MTILGTLCLAAAIYGEARDQPIDGQTAIADVIRTRVESSRYPDNVCEVVFAPRQFAPATEFNEPLALYVALSLAFNENTAGIEATHFHSGPSPYWAKAENFVLVGEIKDHVFYLEE
jgi:spore germination cell wall hydrolase CwlJ-like protein